MGWFNPIGRINNESSSVVPLGCCGCLILIGHKLYHKLILSSTCPVFPTRSSRLDWHIISHIPFCIEMFYTKLLGCTFFTEGHPGQLIALSSYSWRTNSGFQVWLQDVPGDALGFSWPFSQLISLPQNATVRPENSPWSFQNCSSTANLWTESVGGPKKNLPIDSCTSWSCDYCIYMSISWRTL